MQQPGKSTPRLAASGGGGSGDGRSLASSSRGGSASVSQVEPSTSSSSSSSLSVLKSPKPLAQKQERNSNFKVVIRIRPPLPRELSGEIPFQNVVAVDEKEQMITISENIDAVVDEHGQVLANPGPYSAHTLFFDYVYDQNSTQKKVYETTARTVVESALQGYNATIFAYGQTGTGKTYTMEGFNQNGNVENRGIIPRAIEQIFGHIQRHASPRMRFLVRASYLQIYNEQISDLLKPERSNLAIREDKKRGVFVDGLSEWVVRSPAEIYGLMERGGTVRATGETKMNEASSRSHAVFIVIAEQSETIYVDDNGAEMTPEEFQKFVNARGLRKGAATPGPDKLEEHIRQSFKVGKLNLVDLAGSERVRLSGATGQRLEESKQINRSLSALGNVIAALTDSKGRQHIPYRDSKLTRMLEDSLGGNCRTTMMAMISPALEAIVETLSTLKFANRAKNIRNEARVNEDLDQKSLLRKYERELKKLRAELDERNKNVVDMRRLLELDNQRRQAEADKMEAIKALEARSREFMLEKEEKKKLEQRISTLMGQMIRGEKPQSGEGNNQNSGPEMQAILKDHQDKFRIEYENKLANLERERETIEEEKAQVDRYKQLLLKQRDIMIALTQRLVERDEQIMALQDELDAYDRHQKDLEEKLDEKTALLIKMQRISMEVNAHSPFKNEELIQVMDSSAATIADNRWGVTKPTSKSSSAISSNNNINEPTRNDGATEVVQLADDDDSNVNSSAPLTNLQQLGKNFQQSDGKVVVGSVEESAIGGNNYNNATAAAVDVRRILSSELELQLSNLKIDSKSKEPIYFIFNQMMLKIPSSSLGKSNDIGAELSTALYENDRLRQRISDLEQQKSVVKAQQHSMTSVETTALQSRCDILVKEREAVQTIMEQKIKVLVQNIAQASQAILTSSSSVNPNFNQTLSKDIASLQRLVNASIAALKNAASSNPSVPSAVLSTPRPPFPSTSNFNSNSYAPAVPMPQQQYGANSTHQQTLLSSSRLGYPATSNNSSIGRSNSNGSGNGGYDQRSGNNNNSSSNNQFFTGGNNGQIQMDSNPVNVLRNTPPTPSGSGLNSYDSLNIRSAGNRG